MTIHVVLSVLAMMDIKERVNLAIIFVRLTGSLIRLISGNRKAAEGRTVVKKRERFVRALGFYFIEKTETQTTIN